MLLWIHTTEDFFDAERIVQTFEVLSVRHPQLTIPFDKILVVGQAYRSIGEFERAWLVYRATIDSSFLTDSNISAILQDEGQLLGSIDFQESLWWQYPDTADVESSYFALSQLLYENAARAGELKDDTRRIRLRVPGQADPSPTEQPSRIGMIAEAVRLLHGFMTLYPRSPLGDDAAFSLANAYLDLKDFDTVIGLSEAYKSQFGDSEFTSSFQYMIALGHFWERNYEPALAAARVVADGDSRDRDFARYILGQIHHAQGDPARAIDWYTRVSTIYPDAREAIDYFQQKSIALEEVSIFRPGEPVVVDLGYRNIKEAHLQVYKVDLMKLYLREKNLSKITQVNLAGIEPQLVERISLGDGRDYVEKEHGTALNLSDEGAYLVICRGDDLFTSGLVLITPLKIEVQEDAVSGRVRINLIDEVKQLRPAGVHVKAIGAADTTFRSGETDLRGIFIADGLRGPVTAIARDAEARYAFYRGESWLGPPETAAQQAMPPAMMTAPVDYQGNLRQQNDMLQRAYNADWDRMRRSGQKGVQVDQAK
jgi:tetratricopeptide (TPR) repeat protein